MNNLQPDEALYSLLCKYLLNEADQASRQWVDAWRKETPANEEVLAAIRRMLEVPLPAAAYPGLSTDASWQRLKASIGAHEQPVEETIVTPMRRNYLWLKIAAVLVLALGLTWVLMPGKQPQPQVFANAQHAALPDGSKVRLFDGAKMKLESGFGKKERRVAFTGKGEFDVSPDPDAPFVILLGRTEIKVLGTRFTVNYSAGKLVVHVSSGKIQVNDPDGNKSVVLTQGMLLRRNETQEPFTVAEHIPDLEKKQLVFRDVPLKNVILSIETMYDVRIDVQDAALLRKGITSNFENETIDNVMASVAFITNTTVEKTGERQFTLRP
ncbi:FecR domain-containing protein [Chitinophaga sp. GCM10012297]|uniref:FecR domain-containing protein n=1 Tax=Chitinophaga chungangae TaxID=2821488 RepID=A0ABS3YKE8_9BACT|nr:FecR domain-containing protein [Chitinophaga chungangae]MBO9154599.1 FecR domain-containing protein [Chitinophaga chungangae]